MEFLNVIYNEILLPILKQLITTDSIIIMTLILGMTEFIKQGFKHYKNVKALNNWTIRGISMIFGVFFSLAILTIPIKMRLVYGLFYAFTSSVLYLIGKRYIVTKYFPSLSNKLSGQ